MTETAAWKRAGQDSYID